MMQFLVDEDIGPKRSITPQGYLLCLDVPLARTGTMHYAPGEIPVSAKNGMIEIERSPDEVFAPQSLASYSAVPLVNEHGDVTATNWTQRAGGVVLNARRGEGDMNDCVIGDIVVTTPEMIALVQSGKRQVSVGYVCAYDEFEPGRGRQRDIVVNHVALVDRGRCGPRCAIGDKATEATEISMTTSVPATGSNIIKRSLVALRNAIATKDEAAIEKALNGTEAVAELAAEAPALAAAPPPAGGITINLTRDEFPPKKKDDDDDDDDDDKKKKTEDEGEAGGDLATRVAALETGVGEIKAMLVAMSSGKTAEPENAETTVDEKLAGELKEEAPPGTSDAAMTNDSAFLGHSHQETVALAEILAPGIVPPPFNAKHPPAQTFDSICKHRRKALSAALSQPSMMKFVSDGLRTKTVDSLTCSETRQLFKSAAAVKAAINNGTGRTVDQAVIAGGKTVGKISSISDLNKFGQKHFDTGR